MVVHDNKAMATNATLEMFPNARVVSSMATSFSRAMVGRFFGTASCQEPGSEKPGYDNRKRLAGFIAAKVSETVQAELSSKSRKSENLCHFHNPPSNRAISVFSLA